MRRLSLPARMHLVRTVTVVVTGLALWGMGYWLTSAMTWWIALPLCWGVGWAVGWVVFAKVMPFIGQWVIRRWINEQPPEVRYLLLLRLHFGDEGDE